ncbi:biotin/lipoate A/B protein ligase [Thecamonas trahens ATCC 50062]|uniref:Biotin/lipoate A/B protein ligase n=1 Tax=Thecamonas trahens ATCC 50062 TaxID=461836 RepID=A0A0L0DGN9_THETB|nr:biotin/lipoate A/B protein ligase [Thecamonas trahens ATCC 50062]KNC50498.1 biotin/lipoate A/B protein ligase [Thecamonas trahens ATCC 50062]|eukprot:XP_013762391.1 biotin/lipoate A/B protein ligase [Thecamonas trahens ATCC 50062]
MALRPVLRVVREAFGRGGSMLEALRAEEELFRRVIRGEGGGRTAGHAASPPSDGWLVLSRCPEPTVVLGVAGRVSKDVRTEAVAADGVKLVRRYTGGGTVYVAKGTMLASLILDARAVPQLAASASALSPKSLMEWSHHAVYGPALRQDAFALRENDYIAESSSDGAPPPAKFAGNAQSLARHYFVHHTSFLFDFDPALLERYLTLPEKRPQYRASRSHSDFVRALGPHGTGLGWIASPDDFFDAVEASLAHDYDLVPASRADVDAAIAAASAKPLTKYRTQPLDIETELAADAARAARIAAKASKPAKATKK